MGLTMAQQHRQASVQAKEEPYDHHNHTHQQHNSQTQASHIQQQQHSRPPSIVHQHHHTHQHHAQGQTPQPQHQSPYPVYQQQTQAASGQHTQDLYNYQSSPYNAPAAPSGYTSAEMMAATMSRPPYPPMSYHTPQSNSPASVASTAGHDQQRSMYGQPQQLHQQPMYYGQQHQYQSLPPAAPSPYGQHTPAPHQSMASQPSMMMSHGAPSPVPHQMAQHASQHSPASAMTGSPRHAKMEVQSLTPQLSRQAAPPTAPSPLSMSQVQTAQNLQAQGLQTQNLQAHPAQSIHAQQGVQQHQQHQQHPQHAQHQHPQHQHPQHQQHQQHQSHTQHSQHQQHPQQTVQHQQHTQHPQQHSQHATPQNGTSPLPTGQPGSAGSSVVNPNAAPGPIPATTPLVVRQDQNGVQWIAFEYSRDRVKMEYTIRCDVESVVTDDLAPEFKQENCVYPRACCPREQYRGNRLQYESECNTVGWALAQLNPPLRGKRGLIQRAVDSWRNSNQDPRLRSRRVRRMAKMGTRKAVSAANAGMAAGVSQSSPAHLGSATLPSAGAPLGKSLHSLPQQMHHHTDATAQAGGDEVGENEDSYVDDGQHQQHQVVPGGTGMTPTSGVGTQDARPAQVFSSYGGYPGSTPLPPMSSSVAIAHSTGNTGGPSGTKKVVPQPDGLFPDLPEAKKRKFVLVEDRGSRLRVRVTLNMVDTSEIPDSFRRSNAVCPGSFFPREMESPPPSPTGRRFFPADLDDVEDLRLDKEDDGGDEVEAGEEASGGRRRRRRHHRRRLAMAAGGDSLDNTTTLVSIPVGDNAEDEVAIPRMRKALRRKQVRLNDLGCRMAWLQSRAFAGRRIFLQKALDTYRSKTCNGILASMQDVSDIAPHYELRVGKKNWLSCEREMELRQLSRT